MQCLLAYARSETSFQLAASEGCRPLTHGEKRLRLRNLSDRGEKSGVFIVILPALLLFLLSGPPSGPGDASASLVCDDGSSPRLPDGSPNWNCTIEGCSPHDMTCYEERLDHCRDEAQPAVDHCRYQTTECKSKIACFDLWLGCPGEYKCLDEESWIGCNHAQCKTGRRLNTHHPFTAPPKGETAPAPRPRAPLRVFTPKTRPGRGAAPTPSARPAARSRTPSAIVGLESKSRTQKPLASRAARPVR